MLINILAAIMVVIAVAAFIACWRIDHGPGGEKDENAATFDEDKER